MSEHMPSNKTDVSHNCKAFPPGWLRSGMRLMV
jgi:hypothetical protein